MGLLGLIESDLTDVTPRLVAFAREQGFTGLCAHLTVPADTVDPDVAVAAADTIRDQGLEFLQLWGPYPTIVIDDEETRKRGVEGAAAVARLAARMGARASGVRPTSHNPRGDWWPHPDNHTTSTEDTFVRSLSEILVTADDVGVSLVLEAHQTSVLDSPERIRRVIERTDPQRVTVNIDTVNFITDLPTAFDPAPMVDRFFDVLGAHCATVHVKDFYLEDRLVLHVSEAPVGTGMMDVDAVLRRTDALGPDTFAMIEHLPVSQIPLASRNLRGRIRALGIDLH